MSPTKQVVHSQAGGAGEGRVWSTGYMAVAFGLGLTVGLILGQAYGMLWARRDSPATERPAAESAVDEHAGHDHSGHEHH